jgi:hypothetical protein
MSRWNYFTDTSLVPDVPIVHQTNIIHGIPAGSAAAPDPRFHERMPFISTHNKIFGGYVPLVPDLFGQIELHCEMMQPYWRDGAFSQFDIEPWNDHALPNISLIRDAVAYHDRAFGPNRYCFYINPYQMPTLYDELLAEWPDHVLWMPGYREDESDKIARFRPTIHQYDDRVTPPGFVGPTPVNKILRPARLDTITFPPQPLKPLGEVTMPLNKVVPLDGPSRIMPPGRPGPGLVHFMPVQDGTPDEAQAVDVTVTVLTPDRDGHVTVYPGKGEPGGAVPKPPEHAPATSVLAFQSGIRQTASTTVGLVTRNGVRCFAFVIAGGPTDIMMEQSAYYVEAEAADGVPAHNHDGRYAAAGHGHPNYATKNHSHGDEYAAHDHQHRVPASPGKTTSEPV